MQTQHLELTPAFVSQALGLNIKDSSPSFTRVTTDSRKIEKGCLFVAIKGDNFDGNDFVEQALAQGAAGVICKKEKV